MEERPSDASTPPSAGGAWWPPPPPPPPPAPAPNRATLLLSRDVGFGDEPLSLVVAFLAPRDQCRLAATCRGTWRYVPPGLSAADADRVRRDHPLWQTIINIKHGMFKETRLFMAAEKGILARVRELCNRRADIEAADKDGATPLYWASCRGHLDIVRELLARGANANATMEDGWTTLMEASFRGNVEVVRALLAAGADKHRVTTSGRTATFFAEYYESQGSRAILALLAAAP